MAQERGKEQFLGLGLVGNGNRHLRLDDRHETRGKNLPRDVELLGHHGLDSRRIGRADNGTFLGAIDAHLGRAGKKRIEARHRLEDLAAVHLGLEPLVDLEEGDDMAVFPKIGRGRNAVDGAVHRLFKKDRADDLLAGEGGGFDDPGAHGVDKVEHLGLGAISALLNTVEPQRLRGRATRLIECGDKASPFAQLFGLFAVGHGGTP